MFLWRATKESLPTKYNLAKRKVLPYPVCNMCKSEHEDALHALWPCLLIQAACTTEEWFYPVRATQLQDFTNLINRVLNVVDNLKREKFGVICWALWHCRNKYRLNRPMENVNQINTFAQGYLDEFTQCNNRNDPLPVSRT
jgi:hypothetical protein